MMGRIYWGGYTGTLTNAGGNSDLISIQAADDKAIRLRYFSITQISEVGDAAEEGLQLALVQMPATFTVGSGGSAITMTRVDAVDTAFGGTIRCNDTTIATTSGTAAFFGYWGWNVRAQLAEWFPEQYAPRCAQGEGLVLRCDTTPADDLTINISFCVEEV